MTRFVIGCDAALYLAGQTVRIPVEHRLLAPTLLRSQVLAQLYAAMRRGDLDRKAASRRLDHLRSLRIRLLGDRVLQQLAWDIAVELDWPDTYQAEYLALTRLQADAFVTLDDALALRAGQVVPMASIEDVMRPGTPSS